MRKAAKGALAVMTALSATLVPAASNASVVMAPAPVKDASSQRVIILQPENRIVENANNYSRIKRLSDNHEKRAQIQEAEKLRGSCISF